MVLFVLAFGCSLGATGVMFAMIGRINKKAAMADRKPYIGYVVTEVQCLMFACLIVLAVDMIAFQK